MRDEIVDEVRKALGGNLYPLSITKLKWYVADLESAQGAADNGELQQAVRASRRPSDQWAVSLL